jgi:hypothetical protein
MVLTNRYYDNTVDTQQQQHYSLFCLFNGFIHHVQQHFSYIVEVSFIGGGNRRTRRKPTTCRKSLTNFIT